MTRTIRGATTFAIAAAGLFAARAANAQDAGTPTCASLTSPIYLTGSSAFEPTVKAFAVKLEAETTSPFTVVYQKPGSCSGVTALATNADLTGTASYYTPSGTTITTGTCTLPASGQKADIAVSDVYYESCGSLVPATKPPTLVDNLGPVQAMEFIVPKANTTTQYLTAAEAQDIYGCGASAGVAGFSMASGIFCRDNTSGTQIIIADNIGLSPSTPTAPICVTPNPNNSTGMYTAVEGFASPNASIGFLGADVYDAQRANLNALAFEGVNQTMAYFADSSATAVDRQNVRDGHYLPWGYEHMMTIGTPTNANVTAFIKYITGATTGPDFDYVQVEGKAGTIPLCAMQVSRSSDTSLLSHNTPADKCTCAYLASTGTTLPVSCTTCTASTTCTGGTSCFHGYCE